ncbi:MAG: hypothetical protein IJE04_01750 [Bacilli bacterium]|nr:hypothetical protein [Bacilli bacterium]
MKENNGMSTKIVDLKEYSSKEVGLLVQVVLTELVLIFGIINLISDAFMPAFYAILSMILFTMAYNNVKFYKKRYMTSIYIIIGLFVAITTLVEYVF